MSARRPGPAWRVEVACAGAAELHGRALPDPTEAVPTLWWLDVDRPALVLGSTQREEVVDLAACRAAGIDVVRRRSGGGAVLLIPGQCVWLDVLVPAGDPRWDDDVGRAAWWLGEAWAAALDQLGLPDAEVHRGGLVDRPWSSLVCFAGLGPGEVHTGGRKVVGLSQRRVRGLARFQTSIHQVWAPEVLVPLLAPPRPAVAELAPLVLAVDRPAAEIRAALHQALELDRPG